MCPTYLCINEKPIPANHAAAKRTSCCVTLATKPVSALFLSRSPGPLQQLVPQLPEHQLRAVRRAHEHELVRRRPGGRRSPVHLPRGRADRLPERGHATGRALRVPARARGAPVRAPGHRLPRQRLRHHAADRAGLRRLASRWVWRKGLAANTRFRMWLIIGIKRIWKSGRIPFVSEVLILPQYRKNRALNGRISHFRVMTATNICSYEYRFGRSINLSFIKCSSIFVPARTTVGIY